MRAQVSLEYLLVIGIAFVIIVPATYLFFNFSLESGEEIDFFNLEETGRTIVDTAETLYYTGIGSKTTLRVTIPDDLDNVSIIDQRELVFGVDSQVGYNEIVFISQVNITSEAGCGLGSCPVPGLDIQGVKRIQLIANTSEVLIREVS